MHYLRDQDYVQIKLRVKNKVRFTYTSTMKKSDIFN